MGLDLGVEAEVNLEHSQERHRSAYLVVESAIQNGTTEGNGVMMLAAATQPPTSTPTASTPAQTPTPGIGYVAARAERPHQWGAERLGEAASAVLGLAAAAAAAAADAVGMAAPAKAVG